MKYIVALSLIASLLIIGNTASAQTSPLSAKLKIGSMVQVSPAMLAPLPAKKQGVQRYGATFSPAAIPFHRQSPDNSIFGQCAYNSQGRLIFAEGTVPGSPVLSSKSPNSIMEASVNYLGALKNTLGINDPAEEFAVQSAETDELGMTHIRLTQQYRGIPVYNGDVYLHAAKGQVSVFNGSCFPTAAVSTLPLLNSAQAVSTSLASLAGYTRVRALSDKEAALLHYTGPVSELVVYHPGSDPAAATLAYHITVRPNLIERWEYFVDARNGEIIHFYNNTQSDGDVTATGTDLNGVKRTFHAYLENGTYYLVDISRPMFNTTTEEGMIATYDAGNTSPNGNFSASFVTSATNTWSAKAVSAHYFATATYEYYRTVHNLNSINNKGCSIPMIINVADDDGSSMENAYWNGEAAFFGNGGSTFKPLAGGFDVTAHELGHAVVGGSANLEYQGESGALNESFADISGCMLDRDDWRVGEDVMQPNASGFPSGALRDMSNPHNGGTGINSACWQPANVSEMYTGSSDNGGVHINSGVPNYAFYLFASQVGKDKAEKVFYRALLKYLTRSAKFVDARIAVLQAAKDLYGDNSAEMNAAASAFDQVGIRSGTSTTTQTPIPVNPGQDYILYANSSAYAANQVFYSKPDGTSATALSATVMANKPSVTDDGTYVVFIAQDKRMHGIDISSGVQESVIQNDAIWDNAAISKDGNLVAAVTSDKDSTIWVYSYLRGEWAGFRLYNPVTQTGIRNYNVLYADALEWDYDGEYLMYDAYNQLNSKTGTPIDYWDVSFIKVWDKAANNWAAGNVVKMFTNLPQDISIGNPSFSKRSPNIAAFDMVDGTDNSVTILAANLETGEIGQVYSNGSVLGYPNYSKNDDKVIFNALDNMNNSVIGVIGMQSNKISPSGSASLLISKARWGVYFAKGQRPLAVEPGSNSDFVRVFPNPSEGHLRIDLAGYNDTEGTVTVFGSNGKALRDIKYEARRQNVELDLQPLPKGIYTIRIAAGNREAAQKIVKN